MFFKEYFFSGIVDFGVPFSISEKLLNKTLCPLRLVSLVDWEISKKCEISYSYIIISYVVFFSYANFQRSQKRHCY